MSSIYTTVAGDMWDHIAYKTLDSEKYTDVLVKANEEHRNLIVFPAGISLMIPDIETKKPVLPPWQR